MQSFQKIEKCKNMQIYSKHLVIFVSSDFVHTQNTQICVIEMLLNLLYWSEVCDIDNCIERKTAEKPFFITQYRYLIDI